MSVDAWDEIRTAFHVARVGTVSGAAEMLGVHHATVIRHIDALEGRLQTKLFQRHARGYTATEAGQDLLQVAQATDDQFTQLAGRLKGRGLSVSGELVVTSVGVFSPLLVPVLSRFQKANPQVTLKFLTDERVFRLEYGEAHVAIRAGSPPEQPDNVVQKFFENDVSLYATEDYLIEHGEPDVDGDLSGHYFVGPDDPRSRAPFYRWILQNVPAENVVFRASTPRALKYAILEGVGMGFVPIWEAKQHPELLPVSPPKAEWRTQLWLVTHVDLHRTAKVQAVLKYLKDEAKTWTS